MLKITSFCYIAICASLAFWLSGCSKTPEKAKQAETASPAISAIPLGSYRIYTSNETSGDLAIIDSSNFSVIATVPLGKRPRGIHASPDGKTIYVALSGSPPDGPGVDESTLPPPDKSADGIGVFDVASNKLVKIIQGGSDPENFDVSHDGKTLFISNEDASGVSFVDVAQGKVTKTIHTGEEPEGVKVTPDGKLVYATNEEDGTISVIDPVAGKLIKTFKVGRRPRNIAFVPGSAHAYVNAENDGGIVLFDSVKNVMLRAIHLGKPGVVKPMNVLLSPDASKLYVSTGRASKIMVVDTATEKPIGSFEVGKRPWGLAFSPDGKLLFTADGPSNDVSVVDLATQTVIKKINVPGGPWGVITIAR
jgi:YVTN family beta-propeller protein